MPSLNCVLVLQAEADNKLDDATNIEVNTIHSSKGREAENVVVLPDMTSTSFYSYNKDPDNEHRVFYVACTRARENLIVTGIYPGSEFLEDLSVKKD